MGQMYWPEFLSHVQIIGTNGPVLVGLGIGVATPFPIQT